MCVRKYTNKLLEGLEEGIYSYEFVVNAFCNYMSEDDVKDMMESNEMLEEEGEE